MEYPRIAIISQEQQKPNKSDTKKAHRSGDRRALNLSNGNPSAERCDSLGQACKLPRSGVLVEYALGHAPRQFRLSSCQSGGRCGLVAARQCQFDLLEKGADAADACAIDLGAAIVAADALL